MASRLVMYRVTGRYMNGSNVIAYHLVGSDGSQVVANKNRLICLISRGKLENMRVQASGNDIAIRGKGINLNKLPVFDINRGNFRNSTPQNKSISQDEYNKFSQFKLTKRIVYNTNCIGYIVTDRNGHEKKFSIKRIVELATQGLVENAQVKKYMQSDSSDTRLVLVGVGCDVSKLPQVLVDQNGNIIDHSDLAKQEHVFMRAIRMKRGGILYNKSINSRITFEPGDYILCGLNGELQPMKASEAKKRFMVTTGVSDAICDSFLGNLGMYPVELFGSHTQLLSAEQVMKWPIVKVAKA